MCIHSQNLNKIPLLLVTARLLARLNNTNGWSPVTFLDTASPFTQSQCLRMLAGWQLPWSPLGCWCLVRANPFWSVGQMLDECHVLLPDAGLGMEVPSEVTNHVVSVVFEAGGPHPGLLGFFPKKSPLCWAFMTQGFYHCWILSAGCICHRSVEFRTWGYFVHLKNKAETLYSCNSTDIIDTQFLGL